MDSTSNFTEGKQKKFTIYPNTVLGKNISIGEYVVLGIPPKEPTNNLKIGDNAIIRSHSVIYAGNEIGDDFQTGHGAFIQENNKIEGGVSIGTKSVILRDCVIEKGVRIHTQVFIPEYTIIKSKAWVGPNVVLTNTPHPTCSYAKKCMIQKKVIIESNAIIGANVTILPGVTIKEGTIVGAGSTVTENTVKNAVVVGNPARKIKNRDELECISGLTDFPYRDSNNV